MIPCTCTKDEIDYDYLLVSYGDNCPFLSSASSNAVISLTEKRILGTGRSPCCLSDDSFHLFVQVGDSSAFFARTLVAVGAGT